MFLHIDRSPGLTTEQPVVELMENVGGTFYFKATAKIGSIFGQEVHGEVSGIGKTEEIALKRLDEERKQLYESLWA